MNTPGTKIVEVISTAYGPYAFGIASVLIIWFSIMKPELANRQVDYDRAAEQLKQQETLAITMKSTAITMESTASTMEATATAMEGTARVFDAITARIGRDVQ